MSQIIDAETTETDERDETMQVEAPQPMQQPLTRQALATHGMDALDRNRVDAVKVSRAVGGVSFTSMLEVMEFSKLMSVAGQAVPKHLRQQPGMCLAITVQALEWQMSPFAVANKSYAVNDRIAYESQLVHALIEARAPLRERLNAIYEGEGQSRTCEIIGKFRDGTERRYKSPPISGIKVQNSPLWKADPDQQLFYYASRAWCRRWCPDVLLGIYTPEELKDSPEIAAQDADQVQQAGLHERLNAADRSEGHQDGHAIKELANVAAETQTTIKPADAEEEKTADKPKETKAKGRKKKQEPDPKVEQIEKAAAEREQAAPQQTDTPAPKVPTKPKTAAEYDVYARDYIERTADPEEVLKKWEGERDMRDTLAVPMKVRNELRAEIESKHGV